jgi:ABC-2 type transport system ATP-binding protein
MICLKNISKSYGCHQVLHGLNFRVLPGELLGIMGANGAGKSTLFQLLTTLDDVYEGEIRMKGLELRRHRQILRQIIGYVPGHFSLYGDLTVAENLAFFARAYGCGTENLSRFCPSLWAKLEPFSGFRARHLSGGIRQKLSVCCALIHSPELLLLDEPTTGIDPLSRHELWQELLALKSAGTTVLVSTHYLDEADQADRVLFLHEGRQLMLDSPSQILAAYKNNLLAAAGPPVQQLYRLMRHLPGLIMSYIRGDKLCMVLPSGFPPEEIWRYSRENGLELKEVTALLPDLEDVFLERLITAGRREEK